MARPAHTRQILPFVRSGHGREGLGGHTLVRRSEILRNGAPPRPLLQAVGNGGVIVPAVARTADKRESRPQVTAPTVVKPVRIMQPSTATKLETAMRGAVERRTAKGIIPILAGTGLKIGGKTGTGPGPNPPGPESDGWFAGLFSIAELTLALRW